METDSLWESLNGDGAGGEVRWVDVWHREAPAAIRRAYGRGQRDPGWEAWVGHLVHRTHPVPVTELFGQGESPLAWAAPDVDVPGGKGAAREARRWLQRPPAAETADALDALRWCHALPSLAASLPQPLWWDLFGRLLDLATEGAGIPLRERPLPHQLLAGELPLTLAYLFPEIRLARKLARPARRALRNGLVELCDGEGMLHGRWLHLTRPLLACWTRCRVIGDHCRKGPWSEKAQVQYEWLVRTAIRLTRGDGSHVFSADGAAKPDGASDGRSGAWCGELFAAALAHGGNRQDQALAAVTLPGQPKRGDLKGRRLPSPAEHSEWAATATLRTGWDRDEPRLTAVWSDPTVRVELETRRQVLVSGPWSLAIRHSGRPTQLQGPWEEVCWGSDADGDYLELEGEFSGGVRVQRHIFLARKDRFLLLADSVMAHSGGELEYRQSLPLCPGVTCRPAAQTWEAHLLGSQRRALVLPLALPEWRTDPRGGSLQASHDQFVLQQTTSGTALMAPLLWDLKPRRMIRPCTWRQLTVAENREILADDQAVGYRAMVGKHQWLIYRSLGPPGNRTVLGHNLVTEFLVARFRPGGEVEPLIEIE